MKLPNNEPESNANNKKGLGYFLSNDPAWKYISLLLIIVGLVIGVFAILGLFVYAMGFVGEGLDIATYNIENKTGINIWNYITPMFVYGILGTVYFYVKKYLWKYRQYNACKFGLTLLGLGAIVLLYNAFLTVYIVTISGTSKYVLHLMDDGRALMNIDNPIGVVAIHLLVFLLPGLVVSALQIPENNND